MLGENFKTLRKKKGSIKSRRIHQIWYVITIIVTILVIVNILIAVFFSVPHVSDDKANSQSTVTEEVQTMDE